MHARRLRDRRYNVLMNGYMSTSMRRRTNAADLTCYRLDRQQDDETVPGGWCMRCGTRSRRAGGPGSASLPCREHRVYIHVVSTSVLCTVSQSFTAAAAAAAAPAAPCINHPSIDTHMRSYVYSPGDRIVNVSVVQLRIITSLLHHNFHLIACLRHHV